jgi:hypothetical protein
MLVTVTHGQHRRDEEVSFIDARVIDACTVSSVQEYNKAWIVRLTIQMHNQNHCVTFTDPDKKQAETQREYFLMRAKQIAQARIIGCTSQTEIEI